MVDSVPDLHVTGAPSQCFPLYLYELVKSWQSASNVLRHGRG